MAWQGQRLGLQVGGGDPTARAPRHRAAHVHRLQGIVVYTEAYCSLHCVPELFAAAADKGFYSSLCEGLQDVADRTVQVSGRQRRQPG